MKDKIINWIKGLLMSLVDSLHKMTARSSELERQKQMADMEEFVEFASTAYYKNFKDRLKEQVMYAGIDDKHEGPVLETNGKRKALIEILEELEAKERLARELKRD